MNRSPSLKTLGVIGFALAVSSCAVTVDSTKSSSETFENTSDATSDFTSSTSPGDEDSTAKARAVKEFTSTNFDRLRQDMAVGNGERLASLAALLEIPDAKRAAFFRLSKERFSTWFSSEKTSPDEVLSKLMVDLDRHPALLQ